MMRRNCWEPRNQHHGGRGDGTEDGASDIAVEPPKEPRYCDRDLYCLRRLVENSFLNFKQWGRVATRYANRAASFLAICEIRALVIWAKFFDDSALWLPDIALQKRWNHFIGEGGAILWFRNPSAPSGPSK